MNSLQSQRLNLTPGIKRFLKVLEKHSKNLAAGRKAGTIEHYEGVLAVKEMEKAATKHENRFTHFLYYIWTAVNIFGWREKFRNRLDGNDRASTRRDVWRAWTVGVLKSQDEGSESAITEANFAEKSQKGVILFGYMHNRGKICHRERSFSGHIEFKNGQIILVEMHEQVYAVPNINDIQTFEAMLTALKMVYTNTPEEKKDYITKYAENLQKAYREDVETARPELTNQGELSQKEPAASQEIPLEEPPPVRNSPSNNSL